jgi:hypothetical protein
MTTAIQAFLETNSFKPYIIDSDPVPAADEELLSSDPPGLLRG